MAHFRKFFPTDFLNESDLPGDTVVTMESIGTEKLTRPGGASEDKVVLSFVDNKKRWVLNKTCAIVIAKLYGNDTDEWLGKQITLYFDPTIMFGADQVGGIRVKPSKPRVRPK